MTFRSRWSSASPYLLSGLLTVTGTLHFVAPKVFADIVPPQLPSPVGLAYASGVAELACAAGLAIPRTRRAAGWATAALFVAVFPGNIQMALTPATVPRRTKLSSTPDALRRPRLATRPRRQPAFNDHRADRLRGGRPGCPASASAMVDQRSHDDRSGTVGADTAWLYVTMPAPSRYVVGDAGWPQAGSSYEPDDNEPRT